MKIFNELTCKENLINTAISLFPRDFINNGPYKKEEDEGMMGILLTEDCDISTIILSQISDNWIYLTSSRSHRQSHRDLHPFLRRVSLFPFLLSPSGCQKRLPEDWQNEPDEEDEPDGEINLYFKSGHFFCESFYPKPLQRGDESTDVWEEFLIRAARISNHLNLCATPDDSLYKHRFVFNEEEGTLTCGLLVRHELLERYFDETIHHILNVLPRLTTELFAPAVCYIKGDAAFEETTRKIAQALGGESGAVL